MKKIVVLTFVLVLLCLGASAQKISKEEKKAQRELEKAKLELQREQLLETKKYKIIITRGYSVNLSKPYYDYTRNLWLSIDGTQLKSVLPYFGQTRSQNAMVTKMSPLDFTSNNFTYTVTKHKDDVKTPYTEINIHVLKSSTNLIYDIHIEVLEDGIVNMNIDGRDIEKMKYAGEIATLEGESLTD